MINQGTCTHIHVPGIESLITNIPVKHTSYIHMNVSMYKIISQESQVEYLNTWTLHAHSCECIETLITNIHTSYIHMNSHEFT